MPKSMDWLTTMWERVLPRKDIRMLRRVNLVEVFPWSHPAGRFLSKSCPTMTLDECSKEKEETFTRVL
jgi:hypothetical protein